MKAMLLAAGLGERMLPLTLSLPKPAIPVLGRPIAVQILHQLALEGVEDAVVNLHREPEILKRILSTCADVGMPDIHLSHEKKTLMGTAGGLRRAAALLRGDGPILVRNADFLADIDLAAALATHRSRGYPATMVLTESRPGYSGVEVDREGTVLSIGGRPPADGGRVAARYLFCGYQIIEEEILDLIPPERPSHLVEDVYLGLVAQRRLGTHLHRGFWWEFGSPELYLEGSLRLLGISESRLKGIAHHDPLRRIGTAVAAVGPGAQLQDNVEIVGRAALGFACHVSENCRIEDTVVMPESWIGPGCRLKRAVIGPGVELPAGFRVEGALVCCDSCRGTDPPPFTRRVDGLLVRSFRGPSA